jgi:hypothetical protein
MLFPLMMALLFVAPLYGYYWLWRRYDALLQTNPEKGNIFLAVGIVLGSFVGINVINFSPTNMIWSMVFIWSILGLIFLAFYLHFARQQSPQKRKMRPYSWHLQRFLLASFVLVNLAPILGYTAKASYCYFESQDEVATLNQALSAYEQSNQHYPASLAELIPAYLESIPSRPCVEVGSVCEEWWDEKYMADFRFLNLNNSIEAYVLAWFFADSYQGCLLIGLS